MGSLGAVTRGAAMIVPAEYFNPAATLETIENERCTTIYGVPTMFIAMHWRTRASSPEFIVAPQRHHGGQPLPHRGDEKSHR